MALDKWDARFLQVAKIAPPSSETSLPSSLMHFLSGAPMHDVSGVDTRLMMNMAPR